MMLLEPTAANQLNISESFVYQNDGKSTYNDPDRAHSSSICLPVPTERSKSTPSPPEACPSAAPLKKTAKPNIYKIDFPIKPGQSRIDLAYSMPFTSPGEFESKVLYKGAPTRVVTAQGVTVGRHGSY